jgi:hypothetical protein
LQSSPSVSNQLLHAADITSNGSPSNVNFTSGVDATGSMRICDVVVECTSPTRPPRSASSSTRGNSAKEASQSGASSSRLRSTGTSYAELSFKAAARPLKDSANAARQQVLYLTVL